MYCGQCGTPNQDEAGHCETCGAPLLITTGARTCGNCGAALGDHDRFCTTCGAVASEASDSGSYDAADDFGEIDIEDIQLDELPDWLQGMAPSASLPQNQPHSPPQPSANVQPSPDDLPEWLRDNTQSTQSHAPSSQPPQSSSPPPPEPRPVSHQPADEFSLVSDEDLPDWLKALSDDDTTSEPSPSSQQASAQAASRAPEQPTRAVANLYEVPAVSRAWLTQGRSIDQEKITTARQEFSPLEALSSVATEQASRRSIWDTVHEDVAVDEETRPFAVPEQQEEGSGTGRGKLIVRIVILALVVIVALLLAFVLIQGV